MPPVRVKSGTGARQLGCLLSQSRVAQESEVNLVVLATNMAGHEG